jgi:hypothetical protein
MTSAFENLCGPGKPLKVESPDAKEFAGLLRSGRVCMRLASNSRMRRYTEVSRKSACRVENDRRGDGS